MPLDVEENNNMKSKHLDAVLQALKLQKKEATPIPKKAAELDFLPAYLEIMERPPSKVGRLFVFSIMSLCIIALTWSILGRLDIIASSPGQLIISQHSKTIQAPDSAEVANILVRDGQRVEKGDALVKMNHLSAEADMQRLAMHIVYSKLEEVRLRALISDDPVKRFSPPVDADPAQVAEARNYLISEMNEQKANLNSFETQLRENKARQRASEKTLISTQLQLSNVENRFTRMGKLATGGYYPKHQLLELEMELLEKNREHEEQLSLLKQLPIQAETIQAEMEQQYTQWHRSILTRLDEQRRIRIDHMQELIKAQETYRLQTILAPVGGVVQELALHTIGGVVAPGEKLMVIVPQNSDLSAEIKILNKDKGFVLPGQEVEVKIDSFPYTKYGTIKGEVMYVSFDSIEDEQLGLVFPAKIKLSQIYMNIAGEQVELTAGMRVTAEIKIGDRRVIGYLLSPLQEYASEALKEK